MLRDIRIVSLDHLVLTVASIERTVTFYTEVLGMAARTFGDERTALHFGAQKFNLHEVGTVIDPHVLHATPGAADLCLLTDTPMPAVVATLHRHGVAIVDGPVRRTGARGPLESVYFYDPDENLIEVSNQLGSA